MATLLGPSRWHGLGASGAESAEERPNKRLRTSKSHASVLRPVARLVQSPFDTLGSIAGSLGYGARRVQGHQVLSATEQERQLQLLRLQGAKTCEEWEEAASELDHLEGRNEWKEQDASEEYDYELVQTRLERLQDARRRGDVQDMRFQVRTALTRDLGGMGDVVLYKHSRIGTKALIERYVDEVVEIIDQVIGSSGLEARSVADLMMFARQAFGRSALLLSGGGTLGMNHIGVVKALFEAGMLPRIISGASAGSIVCAVLCTKTDEEIPQMLQDFCHGELDVFEKSSDGFSAVRLVERFFTTGIIYESDNLVRVMKNLIGDRTFNEAYNRTRRILNICVSSAGVYEMPKLLNYVTAPDVVIWSAVAASCSVPVIFNAADLMKKDPRTGELVHWNDDSSKWIDGSVDNDLPMTRLAEMFNVNHFIVSQVNPHVMPFLAKDEDEVAPEISGSASARAPRPGWKHTMANLAKGEALHRMHVMAELGLFPNTMTKMRSVLGQRYAGDITIIPEISYTQFPNILTNPTTDFMVRALFNGERATWPKLSRLRIALAVELKLDEAVHKMRTRVAFSPSEVDLRMNSFSRAPTNALSGRGRARRCSKGSYTTSRSPTAQRQMQGRQTVYGAMKSTLDRPATLPAQELVGPSPSVDTTSADETVTQRSSSPTPQSDDNDSDDDASVVSFSSTSPTSPKAKLWSSVRRSFRSQPVTPSVPAKNSWLDIPDSPKTAAPRGAFLTMTPTRDDIPSSPESRYKKLFHSVVPLPTIKSQAGTPESGEVKQASKYGLHLDMSDMVRKKRRSLSTGLQGLMPPNKQ
ncbi:hypothetical protein LTR08_003819 [Meristemomyces frigidus]|nr:hypothetical protein LTR08_003819 [Meristemomyces frigidus]